jgi:hypothetical protein
MDPHVIAEMLSFNDDARQFLNLLHRQRAMSSRSIAAAREFLGTARHWDWSGGLPPPKIESLPVINSLPQGIDGSVDPWLQWKQLQAAPNPLPVILHSPSECHTLSVKLEKGEW